jgi:hypothetical protein
MGPRKLTAPYNPFARASHAESRNCERISANAVIKVRQRGARGIQVVAEDVSRTGCRVQWPHSVKAGDRVWVTFPGLEALEARIIWAADFRFGCKFVVPLHIAVFQQLIDQSISDGRAQRILDSSTYTNRALPLETG